LIVALHGAGGNGHDALLPFREAAEDAGIVLLAPDSRGKSWNARKDEWGPDVDFLDLALAKVFERVDVDERRIALAGFSDGASYALSLGLLNGALLTHVIAFSPGYMRAPINDEKPKVFVSHGSNDPILSAVRCSHRIVSRLERDGYDVRFKEFPGSHVVPPDVSRDAVNWFLDE
jgi:phospholipase/carboxylesterase